MKAFARRLVDLWMICICAAALALAAPVAAQDLGQIDPDQRVTLLADEILYNSETGQLVASGNVEVFYGERTLTADKITYDDSTGRISAEGDIVLRDPTGSTIYASIVDLDVELTDGLISSAQSIIGREGKLAAVEARRVENRFNVLSKAVYSPCKVCQEDPTPLWRIRARRIIHDEEAKQIHYENATFDVLGVPVFWTPYFRHPDPTVDRASGFLAPRFRQSSNYGFGFQAPYYWVIDDHSDVTIAPFFTTQNGIVGEAVYRRAFSNGTLSLGGSVTRTDEFDDGRLQGHIETVGLFKLGEANWGWDIRYASDDAYLRFFDFSNEDRLESEIFVFNYTADQFYDGRLVYFQSLRDSEPRGNIPLVLPDFQARTELPEPVLGGEIGFFVDTAALIRVTDFEPPPLDPTQKPGADTARFSIGADWERSWLTDGGLLLTGFAELRGDVLIQSDNPVELNGTLVRRDRSSFRFAPLAGVEARYPLVWDQGAGVSHVIEPIAQAIVAPFGGNSEDFFNEDSADTEFDELNLFDRSHFSGLDAIEEGPRLNLGLRYARVTQDRIKVDAALGRVFRLRDADEFARGSGLSEAASDWVAAWSVAFDPYFTVRQRLRVDDDFSVNRNEVGLQADYNRFSFSTDYVFLQADPGIGQDDNREEVTAAASIQLADNWRIRGFVQRDIELGEFVETGGGLTFANECCEIDIFIRRRFTDSDDVPASTSGGIQVKLLTLGGSGSGLFDGLGARPDRVVATPGSDR